jgi:hypothetical protein
MKRKLTIFHGHRHDGLEHHQGKDYRAHGRFTG